MNLSYVEQRAKVDFPLFNNEKVYMLPFYKKEGLPSNLKHWQRTVDSMLDGVNTEDVIYLMIDQGFVKANTYHRRPGVHIDGYWNPGINGHGGHRIDMNGSHGGHRITMSGHSHESGGHSTSISVPSGAHVTHSGGHIVTPNNEDVGHRTKPSGGHSISPTPKRRMGEVVINDWEPEGLILASNLTAARAWNGFYDGMPKDGGDCSHIDLSNLKEMEMMAGYAYTGNVTMLHESLLIKQDAYRTVVRLNVTNWTPETLH